VFAMREYQTGRMIIIIHIIIYCLLLALSGAISVAAAAGGSRSYGRILHTQEAPLK